MIELGKKQVLEIFKKKTFGVYLRDDISEKDEYPSSDEVRAGGQRHRKSGRSICLSGFR